MSWFIKQEETGRVIDTSILIMILKGFSFFFLMLSLTFIARWILPLRVLKYLPEMLIILTTIILKLLINRMERKQKENKVIEENKGELNEKN